MDSYEFFFIKMKEAIESNNQLAIQQLEQVDNYDLSSMSLDEAKQLYSILVTN